MPVPEIVKQLAKKRKQLSLSRAVCARVLKIPENSLRRWEVGANKPAVYYRAKIRDLLETIEAIQESQKRKINE